MNKFSIWIGALAAICLSSPAVAAEFSFHGDLNNRFTLYTDQAGVYRGAETVKLFNADEEIIDEDGVDESWGEIKYRLWVEAATNDGAVKGVYAIEIGAVRYGEDDGGTFSGDGRNLETRWAYTEFAVPGTTGRMTLGLQPFAVNPFIWNETAMGIQYQDAFGDIKYRLAWIRGNEFFNDDEEDDLFEDIDSLLVRGDFTPLEGTKAGAFLLYQRSDSADEFEFETEPTADGYVPNVTPLSYQIKRFGGSEFGIWTLGTDGSFTAPSGFGNFFINWDLMYQGGEIDQAIGLANGVLTEFSGDVSAYFLHGDVGVNFGPTRLTFTSWYASGDDNPNDGDVENFLSTDVDRADSIVLMEGGYTDDNYFTEAPHILDKGLFLNKLAVDFKATEKVSLGGALLYMMLAEDLTLADGSQEDALGTELDAYIKYQMYPNVELSLNAGYLLADDAMDFWEVEADGSADTDIFRSTARVRYTF